MPNRVVKAAAVAGAAVALVLVAGAAGAAAGSQSPSVDCEQIHERAADHARAYERLGVEREELLGASVTATSTEVDDLERRGRQEYLLSLAVGTAAPQCFTEADVEMAQAGVLHLVELMDQDEPPGAALG